MNIKHRHCSFLSFIMFMIFMWTQIPLYSELTGTVTGKVIDEETGQGIKGVLIFIQSVGKRGDSHRSYRSETDNNGSFIILEVEDGIYRIGFCPPSPYAWAKVNPPDYSTDEKITVEKGKTLTVFKKLRVGGTVEVRTFELPGKKPLARVDIELYGVNNRLLWRGNGCLTDSNGKMGTDGLDEGIYELDARLEGYGMKRIQYEIKLKETTIIEIPFNSNSTTGVFGYVKCQDGTPLSDIGVGIAREDKYGWNLCYTDKNGFYSTIDLEPGNYTICISGTNPNEKTEDDEDVYIFIKKPVTIIQGEKMQVNFSLDCSMDYDTREDN